MKKPDISEILASIAASYARRELDRSFYDRLMASDIGQKLGNLSSGQKFALEFAAYAASAAVLHQVPNTSPISRFLVEVAADAPAELAKRMINGAHIFTTQEFLSVIKDLSEPELEHISELFNEAEELSQVDTQASVNLYERTNKPELADLADLADRINASSARIRERRKSR